MKKELWASAQGEDEYGKWAEFEYKGVVQRLRLIKPGTFMMGSPDDEPGRYDDEVQHEVTLNNGYWMMDTTVTQELWQAVIGSNPSYFKGPQRPVENVSWNDCEEFIAKLNSELPGLKLSLPTEAKWEYACRAGTTTPFYFGDNVGIDQVNYDGDFPYSDGEGGEYRKKTIAVKALPCNAWGLYQMHGNVLEWCQDRFGEYQAAYAVDPVGPSVGWYRVIRGGSWLDGARFCRSAYRGGCEPGYCLDEFGFRCARVQG